VTGFPQARAILFDLDGTLVDTAPDLGHAANHVRALRGLPLLPLARYRPVASAGVRGLLGVALGLTPEAPDFPEARDAFLAFYRAHPARDSRLFPGMEAVLAALEGRGVPWGVVTNKPEPLTVLLLDQLDLRRRMATVIAATPARRVKPDPDMLLAACVELALAPEQCVYVGDDRRDVAAARAAAMPVVSAAWGYLGVGEDPAAWGADALIQRPDELPGLLPVAAL
jgi:N-acetyl-D-muramate 6-phosphate phosphatase